MEKVKRKQEGSSEADVGNRKQKKEGRDRRVQRAPTSGTQDLWIETLVTGSGFQGDTTAWLCDARKPGRWTQLMLQGGTTAIGGEKVPGG